MIDHTDPLRPQGHRLLINLPDALDSGEAMMKAARIFGAAKFAQAKIVAGSRRLIDDGYSTRQIGQASGFRVYIPIGEGQ